MNELDFPPNFEKLVLGCIDAKFCTAKDEVKAKDLLIQEYRVVWSKTCGLFPTEKEGDFEGPAQEGPSNLARRCRETAGRRGRPIRRPPAAAAASFFSATSVCYGLRSPNG